MQYHRATEPAELIDTLCAKFAGMDAEVLWVLVARGVLPDLVDAERMG